MLVPSDFDVHLAYMELELFGNEHDVLAKTFHNLILFFLSSFYYFVYQSIPFAKEKVDFGSAAFELVDKARLDCF